MVSTNIAKVNLHHARVVSAVIARAISKSNIAIVLAQEARVYWGQIRGLQGGRMKVIWDSSRETPKACTILQRNRKYIRLSKFLTGNFAAVELSQDAVRRTGETVTASRYIPGARHPDPTGVARLVQFCEIKALPLLLGFGTNAHHASSWICC